MLFYHSKEGIRYTAAVRLPDKAAIISMMAKSQDFIQLGLGITFVHPKDNFNKKLGRSVSGQRLADYVFKLKTIEVEAGRTTFVVSAPAEHPTHGVLEIQVKFSTVPQSFNVHLEEVRAV